MPTEEEILKIFSGETEVTPEDIKATQEQLQRYGPFEILRAIYPFEYCPVCSELFIYGKCPKCNVEEISNGTS